MGTSLAINVKQKGWMNSLAQLWVQIAESLDAGKGENVLDGALDTPFKICEETNGYFEWNEKETCLAFD